MAPKRVAIIGAGVGGLTLAKTLQSSEVEVQIFEAWDHWKVRGGALGLAAGKRILESLGLQEELEKVANVGFQMNLRANGSNLGSLDVPACLVMRTDLQKLLVDSLPEGTIKLGHKLIDIVETEDEVLLTFENGARASADLVVASDGIHSFVRQKIFGVDHPVYTGFRVLYSVSSKPFRPNPHKSFIHWMEAEGSGYGVLEMTAGHGASRRDICVMIMKSDADQVTDCWDSTIAQERFAQFAQRAQGSKCNEVLMAAVENAEICFDWGIYQAPCRETWISPQSRCVLLGDAAHATAPFMGQGANMAMHDAYCLGQILQSQKMPLADGLKLYENLRKPYCEKIVASSAKMGMMHTATGLKATFRNHFLSPVILSKLRRVVALDPTQEKPLEKEEGFAQRLSKKIGTMCS